MIGEDILMEIEGTLDQLICNAEVLTKTDLKDLSETEIDAFQKTQESLLQHLLHMDNLLVVKRDSLRCVDRRSANYKIQEKLARFEKMKASYPKNLRVEHTCPLLSKRKTKRFL